jgi:putative ABC transport system permease protein
MGNPLSPLEVVGVIGTVNHLSLGELPRPEMYVPFAQEGFGGMTVVVRAAGDPLRLAGALRDVVRGIDKDQAISEVRLMDDVVSASAAQPKFSAELLGLFAGFAVMLAGLGLYGLIAYTVAQQTREIGIRMALGAQPQDVLRMVLVQGGRMALGGIAVGLIASLALIRVISNLLFGVTATDPMTYAGVSALLLGIALVACYLPARRAMRVDPIVALRYE